MHKHTQFEGIRDPFPHVEYESFIFKVDSMPDSLNDENFQFEFDSYKHVD